MTKHPQPRPQELCPHLAAAVLWMNKTTQATQRGKRKIRNARAYGLATDHLLAL